RGRPLAPRPDKEWLEMTAGPAAAGEAARERSASPSADGAARAGTSTATQALELDNVSIAYDRAPVVRNLTLAVRAGGAVALLGANGAGKTTTLRGISGLLRLTSGAIRLAGRDLAGANPTVRARRGIAHVPHDRGIFFGLTVAEHFRLDGLSTPAQQEAAFEH